MYSSNAKHKVTYENISTANILSLISSVGDEQSPAIKLLTDDKQLTIIKKVSESSDIYFEQSIYDTLLETKTFKINSKNIVSQPDNRIPFPPKRTGRFA